MYWIAGSGRIELNITKSIAAKCSHSGSCDADVNEAMQLPAIKKQLSKINPETLANELREYGAWDENDLSNHKDNLSLILWIACGDIMERNI